MGLERLRIALLRGFDIPGGEMRDDALDWVKEQEDRQERRQHVILVATIVAAVGAWIAALMARSSRSVVIVRSRRKGSEQSWRRRLPLSSCIWNDLANAGSSSPIIRKRAIGEPFFVSIFRRLTSNKSSALCPSCGKQCR
jgi:hypothetical protein